MKQILFLGSTIVVYIIIIYGVREFVGFTSVSVGVESTFDNMTEVVVESNEAQFYDKKLSVWASNMNKMLSEPIDDPILKEANYDKGFEYYLKSQEVIRKFPSQLVNVSNLINKDHANLFLLSSYISHLQFVRTSHIGPNGEAKEASELANQWKPTDENMHQAFEYLKQIVNDINIAVNHNGEGEIYGVTYLWNSEKVTQIEKFVSGG